MSNNEPDYENNLVFAPTSADDLNEQGRQSDVLISAIERCEKLEKQLKIAINALEIYANENNWTEDLGYGYNNKFPEGSDVAQEALAKIKEIK